MSEQPVAWRWRYAAEHSVATGRPLPPGPWRFAYTESQARRIAGEGPVIEVEPLFAPSPAVERVLEAAMEWEAAWPGWSGEGRGDRAYDTVDSLLEAVAALRAFRKEEQGG